MGKAHAVAMSAVAAAFDTSLRPVLEAVCATSQESAERYRKAYGFKSATDDWRQLVNNEHVEAVVIASPQETHREIAVAALECGKPILCEKPLGASLEDSIAMEAAARLSNVTNMVGFNYIRTPVTQFARKLIESGTIGEITWFRGEHTEDFYADPAMPATWRTTGTGNGCMGDLAPHMIQCALALMGPLASLSAEVETVIHERPDGKSGMVSVDNDDQGQLMCRFENGAMGHLFFSRIATGRKMGYAYEITGTRGAIRFDQEDQNALWLYEACGENATRGFRKILAGPDHPDYANFCSGPGHGTGYQDQIIIQAAQFLDAIATKTPAWPDFLVGLNVNKIVSLAHQSSRQRCWLELDNS